MKILLLLLPLYFIGCCKCLMSEYSSTFRIINAAGQDLVFGPNKQYDFNRIKVYSMNGNDTVFHFAGAGLYTGMQDSLMWVVFNNNNYETVFVKLNSVDIDTLILGYRTRNPKGCCGEITNVVPTTYNNNSISKDSLGIINLKK